MHHDELSGSDPMDDIGEMMIGVRMSRSRRVARKFASIDHGPNGAVLVFDQKKLSQNYKIFPFQDQANGATRITGSSEYEEVIKGDIIPMSPYLIGFYANTDDIKNIYGTQSGRNNIRGYILADLSDDEIIALGNGIMHHPKRLGDL